MEPDGTRIAGANRRSSRTSSPGGLSRREVRDGYAGRHRERFGWQGGLSAVKSFVVLVAACHATTPSPAAPTATPATCSDVTTGVVAPIADHVGAALAVIPGTRAISYVDTSADHRVLRRADVASRATAELFALPDGTDTVAWLADESAIAATGTKLVRHAGNTWTDIADLAGTLAGRITRVVIGPDQRQLAIVVHVE